MPEVALIADWDCSARLGIDQANLIFTSVSPSSEALVYLTNSDCYECSETLIFNSTANKTPYCVNVWTPFEWKCRIQTTTVTNPADPTGINFPQVITNEWTTNHIFGEHGVYNMTISSTSGLYTSLITAPDNSIAPLIVWLCVIVGIVTACFTLPQLSHCYHKSNPIGKNNQKSNSNATTNTLTPSSHAVAQKEAQSRSQSNLPSPLGTINTKPPRLDSLDTFRGLCLLLMIFVNYGGGGYWFLDHASWNGVTFADLLFPWFMWISGVSMALSTAGLHRRPQEPGLELKTFSAELWLPVLRRSVILVGLGLFLNNGYSVTVSPHRWRLPGVLQYFGMSYLMVSATVLVCRLWTREALEEHTRRDREQVHGYAPLPPMYAQTGHGPDVSDFKRHSSLNGYSEQSEEGIDSQRDSIYTSGEADVTGLLSGKGSTHSHALLRPDEDQFQRHMRNVCVSPDGWSILLAPSRGHPSAVLVGYRFEWAVQVAIFLTYLLVCLAAKAPGCPVGYNGPGGIGGGTDHSLCTGGVHRYLDTILLGEKNLYKNPTCKALYGCEAYDPEGVLGLLSSCTLMYWGLMAGRVLLHFNTHDGRLRRWLGWSAGILLLAGLLCGFSRDGGVVPVNKNLWSASFSLLAAGGGMIMLSGCYVLVDWWKVWTGAPLRYLGLNSLLIYVGHDVLGGYFPFSYALSTEQDTHAGLLTMNIIGASMWIVVATYCYSTKFFFKI